jgi:hypothetical protein
VSTIVAAGMDDAVVLDFVLGDTVQLALAGSDTDGTSVYQLNLPRPLRADSIKAICVNLVEDCKFDVSALATNT